MPNPKGIELPSFAGLDLRNDPQQIGPGAAVDLLNVDLDQPGRVRSRDGYAKFTSAAGAVAYRSLASFYTTGAVTQLLAGCESRLVALSTAGAIVASDTTLGSGPPFIFARIGTPAAERMYVGNGGANLRKWDGSAWSTPTMTVDGVAGRTSPRGAPYPYGLDNRLACTCFQSTTFGPNGATSSPSHVYWSAAGDPETWLSTDFVQLTPGDGEAIVGATNWRNQFFVFKQSRFFVFYGTGLDGSGNPIFNYRVVEGAGMALTAQQPCDAVTSAPHGVYFANEQGIWLTTGGPATLVSLPVQAIFRGAVPSLWQGGKLNAAQPALPVLRWHDNRLYYAYPSGTSTFNDRLLVHDPALGTWSLWDIPAAGLASFKVSGVSGLMLSYATGTFDIGRQVSGYTQDGGDGTTTGSAISGRYRMGFWNPGQPGSETWIRELLLDGTGTVTVKTAVNDAVTLGAGQAVTLGTVPAVAQGRDRRGSRGRNISYEFSGTAPWSVSRATSVVWGQKAVAAKAA